MIGKTPQTWEFERALGAAAACGCRGLWREAADAAAGMKGEASLNTGSVAATAGAHIALDTSMAASTKLWLRKTKHP